MSVTFEKQAATLQEFIEGWRKWTPEAFLPTFSADCTQTALPFNSGKHTRSRKDLERLFPVLMTTLSNFEVRRYFVQNGLRYY